jgi:hypothetical protein
VVARRTPDFAAAHGGRSVVRPSAPVSRSDAPAARRRKAETTFDDPNLDDEIFRNPRQGSVATA